MDQGSRTLEMRRKGEGFEGCYFVFQYRTLLIRPGENSRPVTGGGHPRLAKDREYVNSKEPAPSGVLTAIS